MVTAENGERKTYTIDAKIKSKSDDSSDEENVFSIEDNWNKNKKIIIVTIIIGAGTVLVIILFILLRKLNDRKNGKLLKDWNKD